MSEQGDQPDPNPYAPPVSTQGVASVTMDSLSQPIPFHGQLAPGDVTNYLRSYDHIGCGAMLRIAVGVLLVFSVFATVIGGAIALILIGVLGWVLVSFVTSILPYRRSVFLSENPKWEAPVSGMMSVEGVTIVRLDGESFFRWDWFGQSVVSDQVVALLPALHPHQPIVITASMLNGLDDWDRLVGVAGLIGTGSDVDEATSESRRYDIRMMLRSRQPRRLPVPSDAIAFEGVISSSDFRHLPPVMVRRNRPTRAYMLIIALAFFAIFVFIGFIRLGVQTLVPTFLFMLIALVLLLFFVVRRIRSQRSSNDTVYYLSGFADDSGVASDFGISSTKVPWQTLRMSELDDQAIALSRPDVRQIIVARRDMFEDDSRWDLFRELVHQKID